MYLSALWGLELQVSGFRFQVSDYMILGITGGMGCGKSTAARLIEARGFRRLDSDALVHEKVLTDPEVVLAISGRHGPAVLHPDGSVNRGVLGARVFADDAELAWLESIVHPRVFALWRGAIGDPADRGSQGPGWVLEVPLLFEKRLENWFDVTVCVACDPEQQFARLEQRGLNRTLAGQRISKQLPLARKIELSDFVLWNGGSPAFLQAQVDKILDSLAA